MVINKHFSNQLQQGQSLVELLVAIALSSLLLPALLTGLYVTNNSKAQTEQRTQAQIFLKETDEAVRAVRESGWESFVVLSGTLHPVTNGTTWSLVSGSETVDGLTRSVVISDVQRNSQGTIVSSGGTVDPSTKQVVNTVSWILPYPSSIESALYFSRYLNNVSYEQTSEAEFSSGSNNGTSVENANGGEVILNLAGGGGDWCNPEFAITTVDLSRQGVPTSIGAYEGNVVTGTGGNASGPTFIKTLISGNDPPIAAIHGEFDNAKANGVFTETDYGYIATTSNAEEVQILNLTQFSNPPTNTLYQKVGWFNAPGNGQGDSIFVTNNVGYVTDGSNLYTFNLSSKIGSRPQLDSISLAGTGNKVVVVGSYAYVAINSTTTQMQIIDVSDPANIFLAASVAVGNSRPGIDVAVNETGTRAYLVTSYASAVTPDFFIINTTNKSGTLSPLGSGYNTNGMTPRGVSLATEDKAIIVGTGGTLQYHVVDLTDENTPVICHNESNNSDAGLAIASGAFAVSSILQNDGYAYSYVATGDSSAELKIILGGAGGQFLSSGTYTSAIYDLGSQSAVNSFIANVEQPANTTISMQIAIAPVGSDLTCNTATYEYVGYDGTSSTYFSLTGTTIAGSLPTSTSGTYQNPGRCLRYKAYLATTDITYSPTLYDVNFNYSP